MYWRLIRWDMERGEEGLKDEPRNLDRDIFFAQYQQGLGKRVST